MGYYSSFDVEIQSDELPLCYEYEAWENLSNWEDEDEYDR